MNTLVRHLYSLIFYLITPLLLVRVWLRGRTLPGYRRRIAERFGHWPDMPTGALWVHSVSVGETIAAKPLIDRWLERHPDMPVLVTTMTPTGSDTVKAQFGDSVHHAYLPWDLPHVQRRLLKRLQPRALVIIETELWPNLLHACQVAKVPVLLANGRLSQRSLRGYQRLHRLIGPMVKNLSGVAAQYAPDAERFGQLGIATERIEVTGSIKFDLPLTPELHSQIDTYRQQLSGRPVWVAASTHAGEDEIFLAVHRTIRAKLPDALLILVPRHPDRFDNVADLLDRDCWRYSRRSRTPKPRKNDAVFLGDTLGELLLFYGVAHVSVVGNTFNGGGGHNPIEPAALAKPILIGPSFFNFQSIVDAMLGEHCLVKVSGNEELTQRLLGLLQSQDLRDTYGQRAYLFFQQQQGALRRLESWIEKHLELDSDANPSSPSRDIRPLSTGH
ncbi:lipid IV(A) 3-deoxy-D-manno-octulosonic acid transferase [Saccharospirillum mangrovi]|uniref:lipid IV(A) 3-deoxy-D-manno-octulosonic acid transferase n=1 Tax=Saccharospirillum mangrovi TaxID=2161747 RepID=UPI000D364F66|nr:lipid IV(A) 3-deoxy-D-manno-octulosonic acid transferase [Saccharospirillum mangrovi]